MLSRVSTFLRVRRRTFFRDGTFEFALAGVLTTVFVCDRYLLHRRAEHDEKESDVRKIILARLDRDIKADFARDREACKTTLQWSRSAPALFNCVVRKIPPLFDGTMSLDGTAVGDVVQVLEERVGPAKMYHLCRVGDAEDPRDDGADGRRTVRVGWFPISHLEKVMDP